MTQQIFVFKISGEAYRDFASIKLTQLLEKSTNVWRAHNSVQYAVCFDAQKT